MRDAADGDLVACVDILRHGDVLSVADAYPLAARALDPGTVLFAQRRAFDRVWRVASHEWVRLLLLLFNLSRMIWVK